MEIANHAIKTKGRFFKIGKLRDEYYVYVTSPSPCNFLQQLKESKKLDLISFVPEIHDRAPRLPFYYEYDKIAAIPLTTYDHWWKNQISDKTRNMARKAAKKGVEIKVVKFDDEFVEGIRSINDESPIRQGRPYWHYKEDLATVKRENITFVDQSDYIGAFLGKELIGYIKLVKGNGKASIMQILSKISHRDKAPNNALMAKAVEICCENKLPYLHYAYWSRRGLGDFKLNHGFQQFNIPRYYVPLNLKGEISLKWHLYHSIKDLLPENWVDLYTHWRARYYSVKYNSQS